MAKADTTTTNNSMLKRLGAQASIALDKKSDFMVGWEAANSKAVQAKIAAYNKRAVDDYAQILIADLDL